MRRGEHIGASRIAERLRRKVRLDCTDLKGRQRRAAQPFSCSVWAQASMLEAECELRDDFRDLRVERMQTLTPLDARFCDEPGKTPADLMSVVDER
jgi:predicted DNA-binding transcriptional regulator YafY